METLNASDMMSGRDVAGFVFFTALGVQNVQCVQLLGVTDRMGYFSTVGCFG